MENKEKEFLAAIQQHKGIIYKVSKIYTNNSEDQHDLFQEIIYQLWKSYDSFNNQSLFSSWMYRVSLNTALTFFKKEERQGFIKKWDEKIEVKEEANETDGENQLAHFYRAVKELNPIEKALIILFLEGQSHKEISKHLGISEVNTRVKLNRIKDKIQKIIKQQGYEF